MVRNYKPKNAFDKGSKLDPRQTIIILKGFFMPLNETRTAHRAATSKRTIRSKFDLINERLLSDKICRDALFRYMSPEMEPFIWLSDTVDLSRDQAFWSALRSCLFECPAVLEPALSLAQLPRYSAFANMKEASIDHGTVRMLKIHCAACPIAEIREHVDPSLLQPVARYLGDADFKSVQKVRSNFFRFAFRAAISLRAGAAEEQAGGTQPKEAYRNTIDICARDMAVILASHLQQLSLNADG